MTLILVRHAMPAFGPSAPPHAWHLSEDGLVQAERLMTHLPDGALLVSSGEPKAWETLGGDEAVTRDHRFDEVSRAEPWGGDFRELRLAYVNGANHPDWEPRAAVAERFDAGIAEHLRRADGRPLVVATHGMAMTLWLTARLGPADPGAFWQDLRFPDAHVVDLTARTIRRHRTL